MSTSRLIVAVLTLAITATAGFAQTPAQDSALGSALELSAPQKATIYQSVSKTQKNNAAPTGFRASVGATVPAAIELAAMPPTIEELMPQTRGLQVAMVEKQVMLVDPKTKQVLSVIAGAP
jgi:hypothetical protein